MNLFIKYSAIAFLLFAFALPLLLIRSYYIYDTAYFTSPHIAIGIESNYGMICLHCEWDAPSRLGLPWDADYYTQPSEDYWNHSPIFYRHIIGVDVGIAHWIIMLIAAIPFALRSIYIKTLLPQYGICPKCDYDMRATPDQCPECGYRTK